MKPINWKTKKLVHDSLLKSPEISAFKVLASLYKGAPTESESDQCLSKIFKNPISVECLIPEDCIDIIYKDDDPNGYPLTHRVLIVLMIESVSIILENKKCVK